MKRIDLEHIIKKKAPEFYDKYPKFFVKILLFVLKKLLFITEINNFLSQNSEKKGIHFLDALFEELNFKLKINKSDIEKIPIDGKLLIVSNHPLGGLDGLALIKSIYEVRQDVKIVVNDILLEVDNLEEFFLPFDLYSNSSQRNNLRNIEKAFEEERAVVFFPAGKVSRLSTKGIRDTKWQNGAFRFGLKHNANILPIFIKGRNSLKFYIVALINDFAAMLLLPSELFNKRNKSIEFIIGDVISSDSIKSQNINAKELADWFYEYLYKISLGNKYIY